MKVKMPRRCRCFRRLSTALLLASTGGGTSRYLTLTLFATSASTPSVFSDRVTAGAGGRNGGGGDNVDVWRDLVAEHYPAHYVVHKLRPSQSISVDGKLDEDAWGEVPWLGNFLDLAGPRYTPTTEKQQPKTKVTWQDASREYSGRLTGSSDPTRVKVRWDDDFLYVGAELQTRNVRPTVVGHCDDLTSDVWSSTTPVLPYFDDDLEFFVDPSMSNYHYVEFEANGNNATYQTLWTLPQSGLGSVAPECGGGDGPNGVCCNTTWNGGRGLCDKPPVEREGEGWTMEMYDRTQRPGNGMKSAVSAAQVTTATTIAKKNLSGASSGSPPSRWTLEVRFPILSNDAHGGLINTFPGSYYPGTDPLLLHPANGRRYWWATFATALHPPWWDSLNSTTVKDSTKIRSRCREVIDEDVERNGGYSQFLIDGNNAGTTCYYEASSWHLGGHRYMHNPDNFGYLEFSDDDEAGGQEEGGEEGLGVGSTGGSEYRRLRRGRWPCRDVRWPARFVLAQIYQAQVAYLTNECLGNGTYATTMEQLLLEDGACTIDNACNVTALSMAVGPGSGVRIEMQLPGGPLDCARYAIGHWQMANWTGGPCFAASVEYGVVSRRDSDAPASPTAPAHVMVRGVIDEARHMRFPPEVGRSGWKDDNGDEHSYSSDSDWLCLDDVGIVSASGATGLFAHEVD